MHYLEKWFKHNGLFIALSTLVATLSALYSVKLFLCALVIIYWMKWVGRSNRFVVAICIWVVLSFCYIEYRLIDNNDAPMLPTTLTWTERYKINGDELRGFMENEAGERYYVVYTMQTEAEKHALQQVSLTGQRFIVTAAEWEDVTTQPKAHAYSFSMATYLQSHNAKGTLNIAAWQAAGQTMTLKTRLANYRWQLNRHIEQTFPQSLVAEAQALLFGDQQHVDDALNRAYQKLGITHLFAISGLHVALLSLFLREVLIRCYVRIQFANTIVAVALPIYACLAGGAPSVWRAVLLVEILLAARVLKGRLGVDDALALAFTCSLLYQPGIALQVGFQLSYIACFSLIYGQRFLQQRYWWQQGFVMTLLCQLLAYPFLLFHFYELSLSSFLANIVFVPLFSFMVLPINVILLVLTYILPSLAKLLFKLYEPLRQVITTLIMEMQQMPYQMWIPGKPSVIVMCVLIATVVSGFILWERGKKGFATLIIIIPALLFTYRHILQTDLMVTFVDVGQGDCIVIELPRREAVYVIDSGGLLRFGEKDWRMKKNEYEVGTQVVVPFLKGKGISSIDTFILTHADADHVEGAEEVMAEIRVQEIHITPSSSSELAMQDVLQAAATTKTPIIEKLAGEQWQLGDVHVQYIWPTEHVYEGNNDSLVLQLSYKAFSALFTGDLEEAGEQALVQQGLVKQTVLKAGHHGSKTSSSEAFIEATSPLVTIFMAGKNNRFNHPHPDVVARFHERGYQTLSTKEQQTIEVRTDGEQVSVQYGQ